MTNEIASQPIARNGVAGSGSVSLGRFHISLPPPQHSKADWNCASLVNLLVSCPRRRQLLRSAVLHRGLAPAVLDGGGAAARFHGVAGKGIGAHAAVHDDVERKPAVVRDALALARQLA